MAQQPRQTSKLTPGYTWDARAGRYADTKTGKYVAFRAVKDELGKVQEQSSANMRVISERLQAGQINLTEWRAQMAQEIKTAHGAAAAAAKGGWAQMSQSDWGYVGSQVRKQYEFLDNFARQISTGEQPLNGRFLVRAEMYGDAAAATFEQERRRYQETSNLMTEERRVTTAKESCPDCAEWAGWGWRPIGTLPRIGASICRVNCQCHFEYRRAEADGSYTLSGDW